MIASKSLKRTCAVMALLGLSLCAAKALAYSYTWTGNTNSLWTGSDNWTRAGCGSPCNEYPDGTDDDATIPENITFTSYSATIDDLTISDSDVRFGGTGSGYCDSLHAYTFDTVTVTASSGNSAQLRGGNCIAIGTN